MTAADVSRLRTRGQDDAAPAWAIHHRLQHEAEHHAHIAVVRDLSADE